MIRTLNGRITMTFEGGIVVEVHGVGFEVHVPATSAFYNKIGETAEVFTALAVREDDLTLYGFETPAELRLFRLLLTVSGIGPKAALSILSAVSVQEAIPAILREDDGVFAKASGVGKKSAQRITLELKDKIESIPELAAYAYQTSEKAPAEASNAADPAIIEKAVSALISLGLSKSDAAEAAKEEYRDGITAEDLILAALRRSK